MSFEDFIKYREWTSRQLQDTYDDLMTLPNKSDASPSKEVTDYLLKLDPKLDLSRHRLSLERKRVIQLYSTALFHQFGGLSIVDKGLLPLGVMTMLRKKKVTWQMVL